MKSLKLSVIIAFLGIVMLSVSSCVVLVKEGKPQRTGWYRHSDNPHHVYTTNPGRSRGHHKEDGHSEEHHKD